MAEPGKRLAGRLALVTGASRGIGAAVARRFASEGAELILIARTIAGLEETDDAVRAAGSHATLVPLDLADFPAIDRLGQAIYERHGRLDVLVGNAAALGTLTPIQQVRPEEWQQVMDLNVTANWRLIRSMHPLLQASPAGRAIFVSSGVAVRPHAYWGSYAVSKSALDMIAGIYAAEQRRGTIRVNILDPGRIRTRMRAQAFPGEDPMTLPAPDEITDWFVDLASADCRRHGERIDVSAGLRTGQA
jgi:NAD(P)-dependent dehydrogenase (short-subunit alcohol dehydrogenase family)